MAFDFPANPSIGQPYVVSGITYIFDGVAWNVSAAPNTAVLTANTRNRIRNPNMIVSQEMGDTASTATQYWVTDQWLTYWQSAVGQAGEGRVTTLSPNGSIYSIHQYVNVADTALSGEWLGVYQPIEGQDIADFRWGTASAKQAVLRFWANSSAAGTYGGCIRSPAANRTFVFSFTLPANTWTEVVKVISGDTGTTAWPTDNTKAGELWFTWAAAGAQTGADGWQSSTVFGSTGQRNGFDTVANHFYLTDVGLYKDPLNTGVAPPWMAPDYADELSRCKRYWSQTAATTRFIATAASAPASTEFTFPVMRVVPTLTRSGPAANCTANLVAVGIGWGRLDLASTAAGDSYAVDQIITLNARIA